MAEKNRLLTEDEIKSLYQQMAMTNQPATSALYSIPIGAVLDWTHITDKAQDAKTARMVAEEMIGEIENHALLEEIIISTHSVRHIPLRETQWWQALKSKYLKEQP